MKSILESENKRLQRLLASNAQVTFVRASASSSKSAWARLFRIVRDQSLSLHSALQKAWTCDCQAPHRSRLQLDTAYTETKTPSFGIVVELEVESELLTGKRQRILLQNNIVAGTQQENKTHGSVAYSASTSSSSLAADISKLSCDLNAAQLVATQKPKKLQKKARFAEAPHVRDQQVFPRPSISSSSLALPTLGSKEKLLRNLCAELRLIQSLGFALDISLETKDSAIISQSRHDRSATCYYRGLLPLRTCC